MLTVLTVGACVAFFSRADEYYFLRPFHPTEWVFKGPELEIATFRLHSGVKSPVWRVFDFHCPPDTVRRELAAHSQSVNGTVFENNPPPTMGIGLFEINGSHHPHFLRQRSVPQRGGITCQLVIWPEFNDRRPWYARAWDSIKSRFHL